jgi:hypothetical protein
MVIKEVRELVVEAHLLRITTEMMVDTVVVMVVMVAMVAVISEVTIGIAGAGISPVIQCGIDQRIYECDFQLWLTDINYMM